MRFGVRLRPGALTATVVGVVIAAVTAPAASAGAPLSVPSFVAGPLLSGRTLIWQDTAGLQALSLGRAPRLLAAGATLSEVATGDGWVALDTGKTLLAGPANGTLAAVGLPAGCMPLTTASGPRNIYSAPDALMAISGRHLVAVVGSGCPLGPRAARHSMRLVSVDLAGHTAGLVRRLERAPLALAVDGSSVALLDSIAIDGTPTLTLLRAHHAATTETVPAANAGQILPAVAIDEAGDVLVTGLTPPLPPGGIAASGAVLTPSGGAFDPGIEATEPLSQSIPARPAVALSDGRLALVTQTGADPDLGESVPTAPDTKIEILNLATNRPVATLDIAPENNILGIALDGATVAWTQQPVTVDLGPPTTNPALPTCEFGSSPTGPPVLETENLDELPAGKITVGSSPPAVACTRGPAPP